MNNQTKLLNIAAHDPAFAKIFKKDKSKSKSKVARPKA
jgi:hypothetical protein